MPFHGHSQSSCTSKVDGLLVLFHFRKLTKSHLKLVFPVERGFERILVQKETVCRNFTQANRSTHRAFLFFTAMQCCYLSTAKVQGATAAVYPVYADMNTHCSPVDEGIHKKREWKAVKNLQSIQKLLWCFWASFCSRLSP